MSGDLPTARDESYPRVLRRSWTPTTSGPMTRLADFLIAFSLLMITLPLLVFTALAIRCDSAGPILDRQVRLGRDGKRFHVFNFRIVKHDSDATGRPWAQRRTRVGAFLR